VVWPLASEPFDDSLALVIGEGIDFSGVSAPVEPRDNNVL